MLLKCFMDLDAFTSVRGLTEVEIPLMTKLNNIFQNCSSLSELNLSLFNIQNMTIMNQAFYECKKLENLDLSNFNIEKVNNMFQLFHGCTGLTTIDLSKFNTKQVGNMTNMLDSTHSLKNTTWGIICMYNRSEVSPESSKKWT